MAMTIPVVTECSKAPQPVDRDTFIDGCDRERALPLWPQPKARPAAV
jgi:hypothetical protein